jgi:hypothetical protein
MNHCAHVEFFVRTFDLGSLSFSFLLKGSESYLGLVRHGALCGARMREEA